MSRTATGVLLLLLVGCSRGPLETPGSPTPPRVDLVTGTLDGEPPDGAPPTGDGDPMLFDLDVASRYKALDYDRSAVTVGPNPAYTDGELTQLSLIFTDWGYGKVTRHCQTMLKPYQLGELLLAADKVAWGDIHDDNVNCPSDTTWKLTVLLTPKVGDPMLVQTSWCDQASGFPPADLKVFLKTVEQVEATACGF